MIKFLSLFILFIIPTLSVGQIEINNKMILVGNDSLRKIENIGFPTEPKDILNVAEARNNGSIYASASGINNITLILSPAIEEYTTGMTVFFKSEGTNTDSLVININGKGFKEIRNVNGSKILAGTLKPDQIIYLKYNGYYFNLIAPHIVTCPNGFIDVNEMYCIEVNERPAQNLIEAMSTCNQINSKLCTWSEWYYACQLSSLSLQNMLNNFEIVDDTSNHAHTLVGVGNGSCTSQSANLGPASAYPFRCCFLKK